MEKMNIAIDGPAGAGKSTVAKKVADALHYIYIDTGAMYRALTWKALQQKIDVHREEDLVQLLDSMTLDLIPTEQGQQIKCNGQNITNEIRKREITDQVSFVASHPRVRKTMVKLQQSLAEQEGVVMDGRDIGTHVLPNAKVKIFLTASLQERAKRRYEELKQKGGKQTLQEIEKDISLRDERDRSREAAPLQKAVNAIDVDTTGLSVAEVVQRILAVVKSQTLPGGEA